MLHKTAANMVPVPTKVSDNARRERALDDRRSITPDVYRDAAVRDKLSTRDRRYLALCKQARLYYKGDFDGAAFRAAIAEPPRPLDMGPPKPDVLKRRKYKGKPIARTHRY